MAIDQADADLIFQTFEARAEELEVRLDESQDLSEEVAFTTGGAFNASLRMEPLIRDIWAALCGRTDTQSAPGYIIFHDWNDDEAFRTTYNLDTSERGAPIRSGA